MGMCNMVCNIVVGGSTIIKRIGLHRLRKCVIRKLLSKKRSSSSLVLGVLLLLVVLANPPINAGDYAYVKYSIDDRESVAIVEVFLDHVIFYNNRTVEELDGKTLAFYVEYNGTRYFLASVKPVYLEPVFVEKKVYVSIGRGVKTTIKLLHNITGSLVGPFPLGSPKLFFGGRFTYLFRWPIGMRGGPDFNAEFKIKTYYRGRIGIRVNNTGSGVVVATFTLIYDTGEQQQIIIRAPPQEAYTKYIDIGEDKGLLEDIAIENVYVNIHGVNYRLDPSTSKLVFYFTDNPLITILVFLTVVASPHLLYLLLSKIPRVISKQRTSRVTTRKYLSRRKK